MLYIRQIEKLKKEKKLTSNSEIAKILGKSRHAIDNKMNGKAKFYVDELIKIAKYYNVPMSFFFEEKKTLDIDAAFDILKELVKERM